MRVSPQYPRRYAPGTGAPLTLSTIRPYTSRPRSTTSFTSETPGAATATGTRTEGWGPSTTWSESGPAGARNENAPPASVVSTTLNLSPLAQRTTGASGGLPSLPSTRPDTGNPARSRSRTGSSSSADGSPGADRAEETADVAANPGAEAVMNPSVSQGLGPGPTLNEPSSPVVASAWRRGGPPNSCFGAAQSSTRAPASGRPSGSSITPESRAVPVPGAAMSSPGAGRRSCGFQSTTGGARGPSAAGAAGPAGGPAAGSGAFGAGSPQAASRASAAARTAARHVGFLARGLRGRHPRRGPGSRWDRRSGSAGATPDPLGSLLEPVLGDLGV